MKKNYLLTRLGPLNGCYLKRIWGTHLSIDEMALFNYELYTVVSN